MKCEECGRECHNIYKKHIEVNFISKNIHIARLLKKRLCYSCYKNWGKIENEKIIY